jgi:hypothetical protein
MRENIRQPPNGCRYAKFNRRPTKPKLVALKKKSKNNIQTIQLNIFNKFYQKEIFEIFKQAKFEHEQLIKYILFQSCIITKSGLVGTIIFHK